MKTILYFSLFIFLSETLIAQTPPWEMPLKIAWSSDGQNFNNSATFQDSSGVPSVIRWKGDTLVCAFQWFRAPQNSTTWDKVAVKFSYDAGLTWTQPTPVTFQGIPTGYQRPFDPTLAVINQDSLRLYFSSSETVPQGGLDSSVNTYSAVSTNGLQFTFEPNPRYDEASKPVIDPAALFFNGLWHYTAPAGAPQDGAYHATASDGVHFTTLPRIPSDQFHNWTGNLMLENTNEMRFYGSGSVIWYNSTSDGTNWNGFLNTNIQGGDPSVVKLPNGQYLMIYVGAPYNNTTFSCGDTLIDSRDGKKYATVKIGTDCWFKQNLNYGNTVTSSILPSPHSQQFNNSIPEKYAYDNDTLNLPLYGGLYEWNELMNYNSTFLQGLCPNGWHVSTDLEWQSVIALAGGSVQDSAGQGGNALKKIGEGMGQGAGTDLVGLSLVHSGDRDGFGIFNGKNLRSIYWTSTKANTNQAYHYTFWAENDTIERLKLGFTTTGFACRCVQNSIPQSIDDEQSLNLNIYPNPFQNKLYLTDYQKDDFYNLSDLSGKIIWSGTFIQNQDFSHLSNGLYFLTVQRKNVSKTFKVIKN